MDPGGDPDSDPGDDPDPGGGDPLPGDTVTITLVPNGASGQTRVNLAVPLPRGALSDAERVRVYAGGSELPSYRRGLATHPDGSLRSVQVQVDVDVDTVSSIDVTLTDQPTADTTSGVDVEQTLTASGDEPLVWAVLPAEWLAASSVAGPVAPQSALSGSGMENLFDGVCDYQRWDTDAFMSEMGERGPWLYDRATALYRGYAITGDASILRSAYRDAHIYMSNISGSGSDTRIGVPTASDDLKYHYSQGMAIHYLLTGDDRYRERAEDVAFRAADLWGSPGYAGGADFWTERHAGFALLAYTWAAMVSDDRAADLIALADDAVTAYREVQETYPSDWADSDARCFAHHADAHGEGYGYFGCSPWMSGILADALDCYARLRAGTSGADEARTGIVELGRAIARHGLDGDGKPYYWMGYDGAGEVDDYEEHWGEPAYTVAMAYHWAGGDDTELHDTAQDLLAGLGSRGEAGHIRSFNWQCRSAPAATWFLLP